MSTSVCGRLALNSSWHPSRSRKYTFGTSSDAIPTWLLAIAAYLSSLAGKAIPCVERSGHGHGRKNVSIELKDDRAALRQEAANKVINHNSRRVEEMYRRPLPGREQHMRLRPVEACLVAWTGTLHPPSLQCASERSSLEKDKVTATAGNGETGLQSTVADQGERCSARPESYP